MMMESLKFRMEVLAISSITLLPSLKFLAGISRAGDGTVMEHQWEKSPQGRPLAVHTIVKHGGMPWQPWSLIRTRTKRSTPKHASVVQHLRLRPPLRVEFSPICGKNPRLPPPSNLRLPPLSHPSHLQETRRLKKPAPRIRRLQNQVRGAHHHHHHHRRHHQHHRHVSSEILTSPLWMDLTICSSAKAPSRSGIFVVSQQNSRHKMEPRKCPWSGKSLRTTQAASPLPRACCWLTGRQEFSGKSWKSPRGTASGEPIQEPSGTL
mmetsp:Transcript_23271/g.37929  ORF Transcript_23271/g.37929 Transcript_23271/m.37929 type:complete len:264 (-) Transcript_23271:648-1439(-)